MRELLVLTFLSGSNEFVCEANNIYSNVVKGKLWDAFVMGCDFDNHKSMMIVIL